MNARLLLRLAVIAGALALGGLGSARAEYSFCNKSSYALSAALGYVSDDRLVTRGWWRLRAGECKRVLTEPVKAGRYYVYAEAIPGHRGPLRSWSGTTPLCVQNDSLFTLRDQDVCAEDPRRQRDFFTVDVTEEAGGAWTTEFSDENNFTVFAAQIAGVQRLLRDVGASEGDIDGYLGNATRNALRGYRRQKGLGDSGIINDTVMDALIADANAQDAQVGFFFCNATLLPVWAAFAGPRGGGAEGYRSTGWWRLGSQECAKVRRGALASEAYYVYGVMEAEDRSVPLAGGDTEFCVAAVQFDASSDEPCDEAGYQTASFRRVDTEGEAAWTFQFTPEQFNPERVNR
ncbi:DUF1036 domain-containing protein [Parvularcula dongshanensis]|uniref:Putative membrane protein n=1 Tax=Parvularcula dongshanensis TaxID=1173995 RepID=A0A840I101_9PROT|nr:DUF1036 domain-containing protein [Parvularcula dongshanensis]MBB4657953.1 putative membrane protein [Parvularcula dongshanensis]